MFHLDLRLLRSFAAVADARSVTRASESLHLTQPTVSGHLKELEAALGFRLFHRTTRTVTLTAEGEHLLSHVHATLASAEALREAVEAMTELRATRFRLGAAMYTLDLAERAALLDAFALALPHIRYMIDNRLQSAQIPDLVDERLDAALLLGIAAPESAADAARPEDTGSIVNETQYPDTLERVVLRREPMRLLVPRGSALAQMNIIAPSALRGHRIAMLSPEHGRALTDPIERFVEGCGAVPEWLSEGNALAIERHAQKHAICAIGVGWFPVLDGLIERPVEGMDFHMDLAIVLGRGANRAARRFFDFAVRWQAARVAGGAVARC
jgi:DNA-binding transcriptional LysR family regulator